MSSYGERRLYMESLRHTTMAVSDYASYSVHGIYYLYFSRFALQAASPRLLIGHFDEFKWNQRVNTILL
jgi:hypothetical protein